MRKSTDPSVFWSKVDIGGEHECWRWRASRNWDGYGNHGIWPWLPQPSQTAHRTAWILTRGVIPQGLHVLHKCGNRWCVNPSHLYLGTQQDNADDMVRDGTRLRGVDKPTAKMTDRLVTRMRRLRMGGAEYRTLAIKFGMDYRVTRAICRGEAWKHVPMPLTPTPFNDRQIPRSEYERLRSR